MVLVVRVDEHRGDGRVEHVSLERIRPPNGLDLEAVLARDRLRLQVDGHIPRRDVAVPDVVLRYNRCWC